ncbi:hypothetical protein BLNAU_12372 [Blattamonas nauphoetae]|uniref:Uncharacterized protein n=1 Tax=Blattamonas nauphoetae TaxID=2049346 RepID=A0ABQ9XJW6_9EUKA|nr:hypothetical protein BLNAU_12372 [Blattamonas nauphoetae]
MRRPCMTSLPHSSPPVSAAGDEAQCRFSSLSPTTSQLITRCPLTLRQTNTNCTSEHGGKQTDQKNTHTADFTACHIVAALTAILAGHT